MVMAKPCLFVNRYKPGSSNNSCLAWIWNEFARPSEYLVDDETVIASSKFDEVLHFKNGEGVEYLRVCYTVIEDDVEKYVVEELDVGLLEDDNGRRES